MTLDRIAEGYVGFRHLARARRGRRDDRDGTAPGQSQLAATPGDLKHDWLRLRHGRLLPGDQKPPATDLVEILDIGILSLDVRRLLPIMRRLVGADCIA